MPTSVSGRLLSGALLCLLLLVTALPARAQEESAPGPIAAPANLQLSPNSAATPFQTAAAWQSFDAGAAGLGQELAGYYSSTFDGRYIYFAPYYNGAYHGNVLRYDTAAPLTSLNSWASFDPGAHGIGVDPDGFTGVILAGQYLYFVPLFNGSEYDGEVLRFDREQPFDSPAAWTTFDPGAHGVGTDPDGYVGGVFDGRYLYLAPYHNGTHYHGEVLRFDTSAPFADAGSWAAFDPGAHGVGVQPAGFYGASFDGRYVYFTPYENDSGKHGELLRYDSQQPFNIASSWTSFDPGAHGVGTDPDGYTGQIIAGGYLYLIPSHNGTAFHGEFLRYDLQANFTSPAAWTSFDPGSHGVGTDPDGYYGAAFDGRFIYFTPFYNGGSYHGEFLRLDTRAPFANSAAWSAFYPGHNGVGSDPDGYLSAVLAGEAIYFTPFYDGTDYHGEVLRLDLDRAVDLSWTSAPGASSYRLFRDGNLIGETSATSWTDGDAQPGAIYTVQSVTASGLISPHAGYLRAPLPGAPLATTDETAPDLQLLNEATLVSGLVQLQLLATDGLDPAGSLSVEIQIDGAWQPAAWNDAVGGYVAYWNSAMEPAGPVSLGVRASDQAGNRQQATLAFDVVPVTPTAISLSTLQSVHEAPVPLLPFFGLLLVLAGGSLSLLRRRP
ncbi:MAG: hypothetical protein H6651_07310 [Ardenticatenales bacterium]|nr:hypothetical protein [Ardenticatenales bacterium]